MIILVLPSVSIWVAYTGPADKNRLAENKYSLPFHQETKFVGSVTTRARKLGLSNWLTDQFGQ